MLVKSVLNANVPIHEAEGVFAVLKGKKKQHTADDQIFLMIHEIDDSGKHILKRYDYVKDNITNKFILEKQGVIAETSEDAKFSLLNLAGDATVLGKTITLRSYDIKKIEDHLLKFQDNPDNYIGKYSKLNPLADLDCGFGCHFREPKPASWLDNELFLLFRDILAVFDSEDPDNDSHLYLLSDPQRERSILSQKQFQNLSYASRDITLQLNKFQQAIEALKYNDSDNNNNFHPVTSYLDKLNCKLRDEYCDNLATPYLLNLFTNFAQNLSELPNDTYREIKLLHRINLLADRLDEKATELKLHEPMHKRLKAVICGIIGAVVGLAIGATVGACVTAWSGGFAALPAAIIGAGKGFALGTTIGLSASGMGGFIGALFGYHNARKKQQAYEPNVRQLALINETKNDVKTMLDLAKENQAKMEVQRPAVQPVEEKKTQINLQDQPKAIDKINRNESFPGKFLNNNALTDNGRKWLKKAYGIKDDIPNNQEKRSALNKK